MTLTRPDLEEVAAALSAEPTSAARGRFHPRYNIAPTDPHFVVLRENHRRILEVARWGFHAPLAAGTEKTRLVINARAETAPFKPLFREAFVKRRCLVVADGFYEWRTVAGRRLPLWFHRADGGILSLAGLWQGDSGQGDSGRGDSAAAPPGQGQGLDFVVLTTGPNELTRPIHDRMPAILEDEDAARWLDHCDMKLLRPAREDLLVATPVSTRVNSVRHDDPACIAAVDPGDPGDPADPARDPQLRLF